MVQQNLSRITIRVIITIKTTRDKIIMEVAMASNLMEEGSKTTGKTIRIKILMILLLIDCLTTMAVSQDLEGEGSLCLPQRMASRVEEELLEILIQQDQLLTIW